MSFRCKFLGALAVTLMTAGTVDAQVRDTRVTSAKAPASLFVSQVSLDNDAPVRKHRKASLRGFYRPVINRKGMPVKRSAPSSTPTLHAAVFSYDEMETGVYTFTVGSNNFEPVITSEGVDSEYGSVFTADVFFNTDSYGESHVWDFYDWVEKATGTTVKATAVTVSPDNMVYACDYNWQLHVINTSDLSVANTLGTLPVSMSVMFFTPDGTMMGLDDEGMLYSIDLSDVSITEIGATGIDLSYGGSAYYDTTTSKVFVANNSRDIVGLYELDLETLSATLVQEFDNDIVLTSMTVLPEKPADDVPGKGSDLTFSFEGNSLSGTVTATAPTETFNGLALTGALNYTFEADGNETTGSTEAGAELSFPFTATEAGMHSFKLTFANTAGSGPASTGSVWLGDDVPQTVTNFSLYNNGEANILMWDAVMQGVHNGYIDADNITYTLTRLSDGEVFEGIAGLTYTDPIEVTQPEFFTYSIKAVGPGGESAAVESNYIVVGAEFYNAFDSQADFNRMKVTGLINEGNNWHYDQWHGAAAVAYNEDTAVESWLISEGIELQGGRDYDYSFKTYGSNAEYGELLSLYIADTDDARTLLQSGTPVIDKMTVNWTRTTPQTIKGTFTCPADGRYYIAFRGCSPADLGTLYVDEIMLSKAPVVALPCAPELTVVRNGELGANITVKAPSLDTEGNALAALTSITLMRDGVAVNTFDNPAPGAVLTWSETLPKSGTYVYSAYATDANGRSETVSYSLVANVLEKPAAPAGLSIVETDEDGVVTLTWSAPLTDIKGQPLNETPLTFAIFAVDSDEPVATGLTETTHTFRAVAEGEQKFVSFRVTATSAAGESGRSAASTVTPAGKATAVPYLESFAGADFSNLWMAETMDDSDAAWALVAASETPAANPHDADGGMLAFAAEYLGDKASVTSGKIALGSGSNPKLTLWYFAQNSREGKDELTVMVNDGSGFKAVDGFSMRDEQTNGWTMRTINLGAYAGKTVQLRLVGTSFRTDNLMLIDNISITNISDDLEASSIVLPSGVAVGQPFTIETYITNNGGDAATDYSVKLYRDGQNIATKRGQAIAGSSAGSVVFSDTALPTWNPTVEYWFEVIFEADGVPGNNTSEKKSVAIQQNTLPSVSGLTATYVDDAKAAVNLAWGEPDVTAPLEGGYTDNFEHLTAYDINPACEWTFVDGDGKNTYGSQMFPFPGVNEPMAFIVLDSDDFNVMYMAHSGHQYLACFNAVGAQTDDWMISPELSGDKQTVRFFARSNNDTYGLESCEVLASSKGTDIADFTLVKAVAQVPVEWTEITAELPAGTKHFAIRCTSNEVFGFFVDDVTYTPAVNPAKDFTIVGYNLYRDGELLNSTPVKELSFTDNTKVDATSKYAASVVYDRGESPLCEAVSPAMSGLDNVAAGTLAVRSAKGCLIISATAPVDVRIFAADGTTVAEATVSAETSFDLPAGVYVVATADKAVKAVVR